MGYTAFSRQRHALSTSFDIFAVTYIEWLNFLPKLVDMLLFSTYKTELPFLVFPYFRVMPPQCSQTLSLQRNKPSSFCTKAMHLLIAVHPWQLCRVTASQSTPGHHHRTNVVSGFHNSAQTSGKIFPRRCRKLKSDLYKDLTFWLSFHSHKFTDIDDPVMLLACVKNAHAQQWDRLFAWCLLRGVPYPVWIGPS